MNLPQGQTGLQNFLEHIERVKKYSGTMVAYCREHNLDYDKFMYHRGRAMNSRKAAPTAAGFAKVQQSVAVRAHVVAPTAATAKQESYPHLPDPKWLAELIHNLLGDK